MSLRWMYLWQVCQLNWRRGAVWHQWISVMWISKKIVNICDKAWNCTCFALPLYWLNLARKYCQLSYSASKFDWLFLNSPVRILMFLIRVKYIFGSAFETDSNQVPAKSISVYWEDVECLWEQIVSNLSIRTWDWEMYTNPTPQIGRPRTQLSLPIFLPGRVSLSIR